MCRGVKQRHELTERYVKTSGSDNLGERGIERERERETASPLCQAIPTARSHNPAQRNQHLTKHNNTITTTTKKEVLLTVSLPHGHRLAALKFVVLAQLHVHRAIAERLQTHGVKREHTRTPSRNSFDHLRSAGQCATPPRRTNGRDRDT